MTQDLLASSSDGARNARPLAHLRTFTIPGPFHLERGGLLPEVVVAYETYGELDAGRSNAVLICHALSGDSHVAQHAPDDDPGWWEALVGAGKHVDTGRWFVICANVLGGCRGSTGPDSLDPRSGARYGAGFPEISLADLVDCQLALLDHLGIGRLRGVLGGSMGGMQAMLWAVRHPARVAGVAVLASAHRLGAQALAFDVVARNAILRDPDFNGGNYHDRPEKPEVGLALARMLGHITYLSRESMQDKFEADRLHPRAMVTAFEKEFSVGSYLAYQGERFVERFDANTYLRLSLAIDRFDLGADQPALTASLAPATCRWLVVSFSSDWLFPPAQSQELTRALIAAGKPVSYCDLRSRAGHDAFLLSHELPLYGSMIQAFLAHCGEGDGAGAPPLPPGVDSLGHAPTDIFYYDRLDYQRILSLIPAGSSVLDLACGAGGLLARLKARGGHRLVGVELDERQVCTAIGRGLDIINADLDEGLSQFAAGAFDVVVLSQALQAVYHVEQVLGEMLRVGRTGIISFPNAAHRVQRRRLHEQGRAPETTGLACYHWYNTPNIRLITLRDFEDLCELKGWQIQDRIYLDSAARGPAAGDPALEADLAVYRISQ